jgi:GNAT superfamily N-acetyltransferase
LLQIERLHGEILPETLDELFALQAQLYRTPVSRPVFDVCLSEIALDERAGLFVARTEAVVGQLVCTVVTEPGKRYGLIGGVVVDERQRGQGIAKQLLALSYKFATEQGCEALELTTSRPGARSLYASEGFGTVDTTVMRRTAT